MAKLNQIVAVVNGKKTEAQKALTVLHRSCSNNELFNGISRTYRPLDDEGETLPSESKQVQLTVDKVLSECQDIVGGLMDIIATQDFANNEAKADVVVDGKIIAKDVPVTYLLFLEKQLTDLGTFVAKLPVLDQANTWSLDENSGLYTTKPYETNRTKKVLQHKILYEATEQHPAQIEKWTEDKNIGKWINVVYSGAIPQTKKNELLKRVKKLEDAVKFARETANSIEVQNVYVSNNIFGYLFGT